MAADSFSQKSHKKEAHSKTLPQIKGHDFQLQAGYPLYSTLPISKVNWSAFVDTFLLDCKYASDFFFSPFPTQSPNIIRTAADFQRELSLNCDLQIKKCQYVKQNFELYILNLFILIMLNVNRFFFVHHWAMPLSANRTLDGTVRITSPNSPLGTQGNICTSKERKKRKKKKKKKTLIIYALYLITRFSHYLKPFIRMQKAMCLVVGVTQIELLNGCISMV